MSRMSEMDITVREMLAEGFSANEISNIMGVPREWVHDVEFDPTCDVSFIDFIDGNTAGEFVYEEEDED